MSCEVRLALGSNLGDREAHLESARIHIEQSILQSMECSPIHETDPVGPPQGPYLNQILRGNCELDPPALLARCQAIEHALGRKRVEHWGPRIIDIDILLYGDLVVDTAALRIPHIYLTCRDFVLRPLSELAPEWPVPPDNITVAAHLETMTSNLC